MRKNTNIPTIRQLAVAAILVLLLAGCNRKSPRETASDSSSVAGRIPARVSHALSSHTPAGTGTGIVASAGAEYRMMSRAIAADAAESTPATSPAPVANRPAATVEVGGPLPPASDPAGAMLVRHGEAIVEVRHIDDAVATIRQTAQQFGGFVANTTIRNGKDEQPSASLEIRVPTAQFDAALGALRTLGKVETVTANAEDVGEEYVDLGARAANARRVEARLVEMLASRTGKLSDVLTVEQELARVRQEIERHDARLRYLERRATLSSLNVTLHQPLALIDRPRPGPIVEAIALAWERTLGMIAWCIASLGIIVPLGVLVGIGVAFWRRISSRGGPLLD